ncbi:efflux RND transporter periplasmic adaptor subunit [Methylobacterium sp. J-043]|jgi:cobalt-zinc-cadmium efflux system membrane fusion protein|uniref:Cobalt-zinc-cadmium efflux system membrane fusion protein n=1 Tax=Methylobacterium goesingense TaxID=243690 RepID=A0ABV2L865_9HYPH|nr:MULTISPECIES: efflux RND transporter periplasmic adaptor subunit [Methylobacteriaceae]MCJ2030806.1 efflux RND transporter periplasmic adaptor subunit [Methylobacterium sp. J-043]KQP04917.1 cation transporter [Methylobacterium sp. Leaf99]KQT49099.1 cation transporter [Methylobacterium sp. Leaf456]UYW33808.1 efflux RND transporter periplasmic adaptor subunit [Methylorubrum extorquens]GJD74493.1 Multidrug resistance protein MdtA [Methylobacterium goesingense]
MRAFLSVAFLAIGIAIGGAFPRVSEVVQGALAAAGLTNARAAPPTNAAMTKPATPAADDGHGHGEHGHEHAEGEPKPAGEHKHSDGEAKPEAGGHKHAEGEAHGHDEEGEGKIKMTAEQAAEQDIKLATVEGGILSRHLLVPGTITQDADRIARVPVRVIGTVSEMRKRLGEAVAKGEVVAVLDSREVAEAKSDFLTATVKADLEKTNFDRQQALWDKRISAESAFLNAKAAYSEATLRVDLARQKLSALGLNAAEVATSAKKDETTPNLSSLRRYELRSPLAGRVVERKVDVGTAVGKEGDPADVYTVADLSSVWIELSVPTTELSKVREGAKVTIVGGDDASRAEGKVVFVSPILNPETRSARVIVSLPNKDMAWRPGTFVTTEVEIAQDKVGVRLPKSAIQTIGGEKVAFVRTQEGFERRDVTIGKADDDAFEILSGLKPGDEVAVANSFVLKAELGKAEADHAH